MNSRQFLNTNLALGALTAIANGGAAVMMLRDSPQWTASQIGEAMLFSVIGFSLVAIAGLAIAGRATVSQALTWQAGVLAALLLLLTVWGSTILLVRPERQTALSWMAGLLSALAIYVFFLSKHAVPKDRFGSLRLPLLVTCGLAIVVDVGVFVRVAGF